MIFTIVLIRDIVGVGPLQGLLNVYSEEAQW